MIIRATLTDWKWMTASKSVRMFFQLHELTSAVLMSPRIEENVNLHIKHCSHPQIQAILEPCHIKDLQHKNKRYTLVIETCSETQKSVKDLIIPVVGDEFDLHIMEAEEEKQQDPPATGDINEQSLKGLHATFFKNKLFQEFLAHKTGETVDDPASCKAVYKAMMQVRSCREINQSDYNSCLQEFNQWIAKRG